MRTTVVSTKGARQWQGIPGIERAPNGRLWVTFYSGGPKEPHPDNEVLVTTSGDDGATWSEPEVVASPPGATRAYDPALWHDPAGRLWLIYNQANLETREFTVWAMVAEDSGAARPRWSAPRRLEVGAPFAVHLNKPTALTTGEWLLPLTWGRYAPETPFPRGHELQGVVISTDQGATWRLRGEVEAPPWALENMVVERRDGSLWMLIRTGSGALWQSVSEDRGESWAAGSPTGIVNPGSRFLIRRLHSGRLLLINTPDPERRRRLCAYLSENDGASWSGGLELDGREKVSYPDAAQAPNGTIYAVHDCDRYGPGEIVLKVFTEDEVLAAGEAGGQRAD